MRWFMSRSIKFIATDFIDERLITAMSARTARLKKELEMLTSDPGPGVSAWPVDDNMTRLQGQILGPTESPYENGIYNLSIDIPDRYPFEPPRIKFLTPIYHPNIDSDGRICLDTLKVQPHGSWTPSININTLLLTIRVLLSTPNADDGLVPDITEEYKRDKLLWFRKAREHTSENAIPRGESAKHESTSESEEENGERLEHSKILGSDEGTGIDPGLASERKGKRSGEDTNINTVEAKIARRTC
jgi:ubiquitin-conjugating enzyme E2 T